MRPDVTAQYITLTVAGREDAHFAGLAPVVVPLTSKADARPAGTHSTQQHSCENRLQCRCC